MLDIEDQFLPLFEQSGGLPELGAELPSLATSVPRCSGCSRVAGSWDGQLLLQDQPQGPLPCLRLSLPPRREAWTSHDLVLNNKNTHSCRSLDPEEARVSTLLVE